MGILILSLIAVFLSLVFAFSNGFNDSANAIATVVSSRTLNPRKAIFVASFFEFLGAALLGTAVAKTIGAGIVDPSLFSDPSQVTMTLMMIFATLIGSSLWNIICPLWGFPVSASHALIGGFIGSAAAAAGPDSVYWTNIWYKVVLVMITSPIIGFFMGYIITKLSYYFVQDSPPGVVRKFRFMEIVSTVLFSISHGSNDGAKPMGLIVFTLTTLNMTMLYNPPPGSDMYIPLWVMVACSAALTLGIMFGGQEVIKTIGHRVYRVRALNSFSAEFGGALIIYISSFLGLPVSSSHIITTSVMGSGFAERPKKIGWMILKNIILAWIFTLPAAALFSAAAFYIFSGCCRIF